MGVIESRLRTPCTTEGSVDPRASGIMLVLENPFGAMQEGEALQAGEVLVYGPGADVFSHGRDVASLQLGMTASEMARQLRALLGDEAPDLPGRRYRIRLDQDRARRLEQVLRRTLEHAPTEPLAPSAAEGLPHDVQEVVSSACEIIASGLPSRMRAPSLRQDRERLFRAAVDVIHARAAAVDLTSLCEDLGIGAETIRLAFREFVGVPPMRYARLHRLHTARDHLKTADPRVDNVKTIAMRCGVRHLGRFSAEYRDLFGEKPSDTFRSATNG
jgi:methylphosphotriester-DNA--protein-cysteine methyltransferase